MRNKRVAPPETLLHRRTFTGEAGRHREWEALQEQWVTDYQPEFATHQQAVLRAAEADWQLRLEEERYDRAEFTLIQEQGDPLNWTPEQHKRLQLLERRLDRAQRTLLRFQRVAEQLRRTRFTETLRLETHVWRHEAHQLAVQTKQRAAARAVAESEPPPPPKPPHKPSPYQQWIEVRVVEGVTVTTLSPPYEGMQALFQKMGNPHHLVERNMQLYEPLPPEYEWARKPDGQPALEMRWITTVEEFCKDMERDLEHGNGTSPKVCTCRSMEKRRKMAKRIKVKRKSKTARDIPIIEQWVEVTVKGETVLTELFPSNQELLEESQKMDPPPLLVYRRINFPTRVPSNYGWTKPDEQTRRYGGGCVQRMKFAIWLETIAREASDPNGHIGPTGHPAVPRPLERGGCDCPTCKANHHVLGELGLAT